MDFTLQISRDNTVNSYYNVDLFPEQQLDYDLDFYDSLEIDKVKLPFFTKIRIPLTNRNKGSNVFDFDPFTSPSADFPKDDFYFKIIVYGSSSNTEIAGILNVVSFEYNSSESYIEVDLKDFLSKYLAGMKDIKLGTLYGETNSYYRDRHTFAQFLQSTSNGGEAGIIGQNPDYTRPISFPYVDFCNDVDGKFNYAARQFLEYGPGLNRTGIMPVFSVPKFFEYIGSYLNTASFPVSVDSKLFGLGSFAGNPAYTEFQAEKLHMVVPSQLLAKEDVNRRRFSLRQSPAWAGTNTNLDSCIEIDGTAMEIHTDWWGSMETAGNYGTVNDSDPIYSVQQWGAEKQMGFYPYDYTNGIDEDGIRGFFCPKVSFNADITIPSSSVTIRNLQYEIPVIQRDKMVKDILLSDPDTNMTFKLYVGIYADGTMKKKIALQDSNGDDIVLDTTGATVSQGYSEKGNYQQSQPQYRKCNTGPNNPIDVAIIDNGATWADKIDFPDVNVNFPSGQEIFIDGGSEYSINYFLEPLDGTLKIEYVGAYSFVSIYWREFGTTPPEAFGVGDIKKAITRIGDPSGVGDYGLLNINFVSNSDTFIYKTDDEFSIEDSINQTSPLNVSDILPAVLKRFDCGLFYKFSNGVNILRIDPLSIVRDGTENINSLVDDLKSVKITNGGDKAKTLNINNKDYGLYFDDLDNDDITIGSTTQNINTDGIAELKINLNSSIYYKSVCGEESGEYNELLNYQAFSAAQLGFTENVFTPNKDIGLRFAYLDKPLYKTNMLVPYTTLKGFNQGSDMKTESQIIFSNVDLSPLSTNIGGQHIFNGRLFHYNTDGWNLMFEDLNGSTTQSYTRLFQISEKILQSQNPRIEFDMVVPTVELASLDFFLQTLEATRFTQSTIKVKSAKGQVFDDYAYLTIEGILQ